MVHDRRSPHPGSVDMPTLLARPVRLAASVRNRLKTIARGHKSPHRDRVRARSSSTPPADAATPGSPASVTSTRTRCVSGGAGSPTRVRPGWSTGPAAGGRHGSARSRWPRSRHWPANYPLRPPHRWRGGVTPSSPGRPSCAGSSRRSRPPRCGAGSSPTRSSPGGTGRGSPSVIPTSGSRPAGCSTSTLGSVAG